MCPLSAVRTCWDELSQSLSLQAPAIRCASVRRETRPLCLVCFLFRFHAVGEESDYCTYAEKVAPPSLMELLDDWFWAVERV